MQTISTTDCKHRRPIDSMSEDLPIINEDEEEGSSTNAGSATTPASPHITKDEKLVVCSRAVVMGVMLLTALLIAGMTYRIVSENEHSNFVAQVRLARSAKGSRRRRR